MKKFMIFAATLLAATSAFAQEAAAAATTYAAGDKGMIALAAGLGIALAVFGGAMGQGKAAVAALEGIARNPAASAKLFVPLILSLALIESLVILAFLVNFVKLASVF